MKRRQENLKNGGRGKQIDVKILAKNLSNLSHRIFKFSFETDMVSWILRLLTVRRSTIQREWETDCYTQTLRYCKTFNYSNYGMKFLFFFLSVSSSLLLFLYFLHLIPLFDSFRVLIRLRLFFQWLSIRRIPIFIEFYLLW